MPSGPDIGAAANAIGCSRYVDRYAKMLRKNTTKKTHLPIPKQQPLSNCRFTKAGIGRSDSLPDVNCASVRSAAEA